MKKIIIALCIAVLFMSVLPVSAAITTVTYPDVTLYNCENGNAPDVWDLTYGNLTLTYTIDMSGISYPILAATQIGLREEGGDNINPNNIGGWLQSNYILGTSHEFMPDLNDFHKLMSHAVLHQKYDVDEDGIIPPVWYLCNYDFWFDRGGVGPFHAGFWQYKDGITYNTGGIYHVKIEYKNIDPTKSTMFAEINGEEQGFYTSVCDPSNPPDMMPVGKTFTGDMSNMQAFWGRCGGCGTVEITDICITYTTPDPTPVPEFPTLALPAILLFGLVFTAITIRRMK